MGKATNKKRIQKRFASYCTKHRQQIFWMIVTLIAGFVLTLGLRSITKQPLGFDEGINLQAPINMANHGKYASFGAMYKGQDKIFDAYLSTGPAVSVPIAIMYKIFGTGVVQARIIMLGYYVTAIYLMAYLAYRRSRSWWSLLGAATILLVISSGINFRLEILGEIPAVVFALGSLIAWQKERYVLSGVLAGLAALCKTIMLMLGAAGVITLAVWWLYEKNKRHDVFLLGRKWIIGAGSLLVFWEFVRFWQVGLDNRAYITSLREFVHFFKTNGSGVEATGSTGLTIAHKANMLISNISLESWQISVVIAIVGALLNYYRKKFYRFFSPYNYLYGFMFVGIYLSWWFILSNGAYTRYTVPVVSFGLALVVAIIVEVRKGFKTNRSKQCADAGLAVIAVFMVISIWRNHVPALNQQYNLTLQQQKTVAQKVQASGARELVHIGWWQNPEILTLSGLHSKDEQLLTENETGYLMLSPAMRDIAPADYKLGIGQCHNNFILRQDDYILCKITKPKSNS